MENVIASLQSQVKNLTEKLKLYENCGQIQDVAQDLAPVIMTEEFFNMGYISLM